MSRTPDETPREVAGHESGVSDGVSGPRRVVVGLGNPGERYVDTRHNVGFRVVEELARRGAATLDDSECNSRVAAIEVAGESEAPAVAVLLAAPQTYMNRSGHAVRCLQERRGLESEEFLVVYDEIHLPLGTLRLRRRGSPAGHRGLESVLESLGTDRVPRLRLGVGGQDGPPEGGEDLVSFVLEPFARDEQDRVEAMIRRAADACEAWAVGGVEIAMQRFNGPLPAES